MKKKSKLNFESRSLKNLCMDFLSTNGQLVLVLSKAEFMYSIQSFAWRVVKSVAFIVKNLKEKLQKGF